MEYKYIKNKRFKQNGLLFFTIQKRIGEIYRKNKGIEKIIKRGYQIKKQGFCIGKESYKINWKNDTIVIILSEKIRV